MKAPTRSIRLTIALWYVGILTGSLTLFGWLLYSRVAVGLSRGMDSALSLQATGIANTIQAFWDAEQAARKLAPGNWVGAPASTLSEEVSMGRFNALVSRWAEQTNNLQVGNPVRILDKSGKPMAASRVFPDLSESDGEAVAQQTSLQRVLYQTFTNPMNNLRLRVATLPISQDTHRLYFVQVAGSLAHIDESLTRLKKWLLWLIPLTVIGTGAGGWLLTNRLLRPLSRMMEQTQRINAERLHQRLPVPKTDDELEQLAVAFNDLLERLEVGFNRLRQFSGAASHELRTPLTVIKGELEVALRKPRTSEEYRRVLRTQLQAVDEMTQIVKELLILARSEAVQGVLERRPIELGELTREVTQRWKSVADAKQMELNVEAASAVWVLGERRLLERVIANLIDNAIRHTPAEGRVTLRVESREPQACLAVQDTGPGIAPEELNRIFERFFKPHNGLDAGHSTGIGLGLCQWIAEAHQGFIEASSAPGQGATFTVWLPISREFSLPAVTRRPRPSRRKASQPIS